MFSSSSSSRLGSTCLVASVLALVIGGSPIWAAEGRVRRASSTSATPPPSTRQADDRDRPPAPADDADPTEARRLHVNDNDWFRDPSYRDDFNATGGSVNGEFPSAEVHDAVVANARAATARMIFRRAESALAGAVRDAKRRFEASAELKQALADEKAAHAAFDRARREALADVVASPKYRAILTMHQDLGEQILVRRQEMEAFGYRDTLPVIARPGHPESSDLFAIATLRLQMAGDARAMERQAIEASEELRLARERLVDAARKVSDLRSDFDNALRDDPDLLAARHALEDARIGKVATAAYLRGSLIAADEALDFAWYLHRRDAQVAGYNPYAYDSYFGYGRYGGYYWR
jgi:hypothetical protein